MVGEVLSSVAQRKHQAGPRMASNTLKLLVLLTVCNYVTPTPVKKLNQTVESVFPVTTTNESTPALRLEGKNLLQEMLGDEAGYENGDGTKELGGGKVPTRFEIRTLTSGQHYVLSAVKTDEEKALTNPSAKPQNYVGTKPDFSKYRPIGKDVAWCSYPYHCLQGSLCPTRECPAGAFCCRSVMGICCHYSNTGVTAPENKRPATPIEKPEVPYTGGPSSAPYPDPRQPPPHYHEKPLAPHHPDGPAYEAAGQIFAPVEYGPVPDPMPHPDLELYGTRPSLPDEGYNSPPGSFDHPSLPYEEYERADPYEPPYSDNYDDRLHLQSMYQPPGVSRPHYTEVLGSDSAYATRPFDASKMAHPLFGGGEAGFQQGGPLPYDGQPVIPQYPAGKGDMDYLTDQNEDDVNPSPISSLYVHANPPSGSPTSINTLLEQMAGVPESMPYLQPVGDYPSIRTVIEQPEEPEPVREILEDSYASSYSFNMPQNSNSAYDSSEYAFMNSQSYPSPGSQMYNSSVASDYAANSTTGYGSPQYVTRDSPGAALVYVVPAYGVPRYGAPGHGYHGSSLLAPGLVKVYGAPSNRGVAGYGTGSGLVYGMRGSHAPSQTMPVYSAPSYGAQGYHVPSRPIPIYAAPPAPAYGVRGYPVPARPIPVYAAPSAPAYGTQGYHVPPRPIPVYAAPSAPAYGAQGYHVPPRPIPVYAAPSAPAYGAQGYHVPPRPVPVHAAPSAPAYGAQGYHVPPRPVPVHAAPSAPAYGAQGYHVPPRPVPVHTAPSAPAYGAQGYHVPPRPVPVHAAHGAQGYHVPPRPVPVHAAHGAQGYHVPPRPVPVHAAHGAQGYHVPPRPVPVHAAHGAQGYHVPPRPVPVHAAHGAQGYHVPPRPVPVHAAHGAQGYHVPPRPVPVHAAHGAQGYHVPPRPVPVHAAHGAQGYHVPPRPVPVHAAHGAQGYHVPPRPVPVHAAHGAQGYHVPPRPMPYATGHAAYVSGVPTLGTHASTAVGYYGPPRHMPGYAHPSRGVPQHAALPAYSVHGYRAQHGPGRIVLPAPRVAPGYATPYVHRTLTHPVVTKPGYGVPTSGVMRHPVPVHRTPGYPGLSSPYRIVPSAHGYMSQNPYNRRPRPSISYVPHATPLMPPSHHVPSAYRVLTPYSDHSSRPFTQPIHPHPSYAKTYGFTPLPSPPNPFQQYPYSHYRPRVPYANLQHINYAPKVVSPGRTAYRRRYQG